MKMRLVVAVMKRVMVIMSVLEWEANSMDGMNVSMHRNVNVMLSMSMREWWGYMALLKIVSIWPKVPGQFPVLAFEFTANVFISLFTVFDCLVVVFA